MRGESSLASETSSLRETSPEAQPPLMPPPSSSAVSATLRLGLVILVCAN